MASYPTDRKAILAGYSDEFQLLHGEISRMVRQLFPDAEPVQEFGIAAWSAPISNPPPEDGWKGTMSRTHLMVGPTEKKAGITIHFWHPKRPDLLESEAGWLKTAGFKPMVGCVQWNQKTPLPIEAVDRLLHTMATIP